jgi:hypothetical protein
MGTANDYRRQQDLLFQQIEEAAALANQARDAKIDALLKGKRFLKALAVFGITPEEFRARLQKHLVEKDKDLS